jgi:hypothetical protein
MTPTNPRYTLSTESLAAIAQVKPSSIRVRYCRTGSYFGLRPMKLPNGRLAWPDDAEQRLYQAAESDSSAA